MGILRQRRSKARTAPDGSPAPTCQKHPTIEAEYRGSYYARPIYRCAACNPDDMPPTLEP